MKFQIKAVLGAVLMAGAAGCLATPATAMPGLGTAVAQQVETPKADNVYYRCGYYGCHRRYYYGYARPYRYYGYRRYGYGYGYYRPHYGLGLRFF